MPEIVIGYEEVEVDVVTSRPCKWTGEGVTGFTELPALIQKRYLPRAIYKSLGPKVHTTVDSTLSGMKEIPIWGTNTDDATGKHRK